MATIARDVMQTQVVSVSPDDPLSAVQQLFSEEEIHGAPVVDDLGRILGVVTSLDLIRGAAEEHERGGIRLRYYRDGVALSGVEPGALEASEDTTVRDVMTEGAVAVAPTAAVAEVARTLRENHVHRVLVVEDGRLLGIISTFDLLELLETAA